VDDAEGYTNSRIAYARARSPYESITSGYDLYVMDRDGSNRQRVYPPEGDLGLKSPDVAWGPEGRQLITIYQNDLFLIDLDQNSSRRLTVDSSIRSVDWER
jgi:Tol biopolymer transport system component